MNNKSSPGEGVPTDDEFNWRRQAHCGQIYFLPSDMWFAEEHSVSASIATETCFTCPVRKECLKEACDNKEPYGIWGGLPASIRSKKGMVHNFLKLVDLLDPYNTEDRSSPFHINNLHEGGTDERE